MCGILVSIERGNTVAQEFNDTIPWIAGRGPDSLQTEKVLVVTADDEFVTLKCASSVLHLRGQEVTVQPLYPDAGDLLCWNGEVWKGLDIKDDENDGLKLLEALSKTTEVWKVMGQIEGPWALVYFSAKVNKIWYGRDCLGRRSLLRKKTSSGGLLLSSVGIDMEGWEEVEVDGLWCLDLSESCSSQDMYPGKLIPWVWETCEALTEGHSSEQMNRPYPPMNKALPHTLEEDPATTPEFLQILISALSIRTRTIPHTHAHLNLNSKSNNTRVAVLFSGGLDCSVMAWLIHTLLPPNEAIDLINVAFENPRTVTAQKTRAEDVYNVCPDRITGRAGWEELCKLSADQGRNWRFIEIDVPYSETTAKRDEILRLMYPNDSVMDLSIAMAFYFSARGEGHELLYDRTRRPYKTPAKVYFSGLGADEQLGGYSRHAAAWKQSNGDWNAIINELDHDLTRLPYRNLGRDDRIISNFGREVRYPFLDERVITYLSLLRADQKVSPGLTGDDPVGIGLGDKRLLRRVAMSLGLPRAAKEKKRAVQFGSRSARMEEGVKVKGNDKLNRS